MVPRQRSHTRRALPQLRCQCLVRLSPVARLFTLVGATHMVLVVMPSSLLVGLWASPAASMRALTGVCMTRVLATSALISEIGRALSLQTSTPALPSPALSSPAPRCSSASKAAGLRSLRCNCRRRQRRPRRPRPSSPWRSSVARSRQLDIELELKQAAATVAKSGRDAARDAARHADRPGQADGHLAAQDGSRRLSSSSMHRTRGRCQMRMSSSSGRRRPGPTLDCSRPASGTRRPPRPPPMSMLP